MKRPGHRQPDRPTGILFSKAHRTITGRLASRNHNLPATIEVSRRQHVIIPRPIAQRRRRDLIGSDQRDHPAGTGSRRLLHQPTPTVHQSQRIIKFKRTGNVERRVFAQAQAAGKRELLPAAARLQKGLPDRNAGDKDGGLLDVGLFEGFGGPFKTRSGQVESKHVVGSEEYVSGPLARSGDILAHTDRLRSLAWKNDRCLTH